MNLWQVVSEGAQFVASLTTIVALVFVAAQLHVDAQSSRVQAWAFLLDTSNSRWSAYGSAQQPREKTFALGELLNFFEVLAGDVNRRKLPSAIVEQVDPYLVGAVAMMSRDSEMANEIRSLRVNDKTFCELRDFCAERINKFGDYQLVAKLFAARSLEG